MPPPLTSERAVTSWSPDVPAILTVLVLGALYLHAVRANSPWPRGRTLGFCAGLVSILMVTCSFLGVYDGALFWVRAVQTTVLLMITPLLLALGAPVTLLMRSIPHTIADRLRRVGRGRVARVLTFPLVVTVALIAPRRWQRPGVPNRANAGDW